MIKKPYSIPTTLFAASLSAFMLLAAPQAGFVSQSHAATCPAGNVALEAGNAFVSAARNRSSSQFASALRSHTDMRRIAFFALGKYRKKLPKNAEGKYVKLTSRYIARTLADFSRKFRASSVEIVRCQGKTVESRLKQLGGRPPQKVLWRVSGSRVNDVNVQNVWLGQLLRSNFGSVMRKGGGDIRVLFAHLGATPSPEPKADK